jgi:hypothetical protein
MSGDPQPQPRPCSLPISSLAPGDIDGGFLAFNGTTWDSSIQLPIPVEVLDDSNVPDIPTAATYGNLYKKIGDSSLYWATQAGGEVVIGGVTQQVTTFADNVFRIYNSDINSKQLEFNLSSVNSGTTNTIYISKYDSILPSYLSNNLMIGNTSYLITGDQNTVVGRSSGSTITSGTANTLLGYNTQTGSATATNRIVLGSGATGVSDYSLTIANNITDFYFSSLTTDNTSNILYYNTTTKKITQDTIRINNITNTVNTQTILPLGSYDIGAALTPYTNSYFTNTHTVNLTISGLDSNEILISNGSSPITSISYSSSALASNIMLRDSSANVLINNIISNLTSTVSANSTTIITAASSRTQVLTGTSSQTYTLPLTLSSGHSFTFINKSSGNLIVNNSSNVLVTTILPGATAIITFYSGSYDVSFVLPSNSQYSTSGLSITGTLAVSDTSSLKSVNPLTNATFSLGTSSLRWLNLYTNNLQMSSGASNNYIMKSDASGNASWADPSTISATSITGTANQVLVNGTSATPTSGAITLTLPQSIATTSAPTFAGATLTSTLTSRDIIPLNSTYSLGSALIPYANIYGNITTTTQNSITIMTGLTTFTTTNLKLNSTPAINYVMRSSADGTASWVAVSSLIVAGTGIVSTPSSNVITLSTAQNIATSASPTFAGATLTSTLTSRDIIPLNSTYSLGSALIPYANIYGNITTTTQNSITVMTGLTTFTTTNLKLNSTPVINYVMRSSADGTASWVAVSSLIVAGTGIVSTPSSNVITLSTAQNIATSATPTFAGINTSIISNANGTVSAPSYTFTSSPTSGMYLSASNQVSLTTSGQEAVTIDSSGNVTIPHNLTVNGTTTTVTSTTVEIKDNVVILNYGNTGDTLDSGIAINYLTTGFSAIYRAVGGGFYMKDGVNITMGQNITGGTLANLFVATANCTSVVTSSFQLSTGASNGYFLVSNGSGVSSWANPTSIAVTSITGTADQILVNGTSTPTSGAITLTLPQNIATTSTPTFNNVILSMTNGNILFYSNAIAQNSNLFWDNTNAYLGIGINTSLLSKLHVYSAAASTNWISGTSIQSDVIATVQRPSYANTTGGRSPIALSFRTDAFSEGGGSEYKWNTAISDIVRLVATPMSYIEVSDVTGGTHAKFEIFVNIPSKGTQPTMTNPTITMFSNYIGIGQTTPISPLHISVANEAGPTTLYSILRIDSDITAYAASTTSYGIYNNPTYAVSTGSYTSIYGIYNTPNLTAITCTSAYGEYIQLKGSGTITDTYSLYVANPHMGTNKYALYTENLTIGGSTTSQHIIPVTNNLYNLGSASFYFANVYSTNITGTIATASQPSITSVGTLSSLSITNDLSINSGNVIITTGNILPSNTGNTQSLGSTTKYFANLYSTTINSTTLNGTIATASQPSITSIGTLSSLSVTNDLNVNSGNIIVSAGNILPSNTGNTQSLGSTTKYFANLYSTTINSTTLNGTIATASQPSITSIGTLSSLTVTNDLNVNSGNVIITTGNILPSNTGNTQSLGSTTKYFANLYSTNINGTIATASQPSITSVGTLSSLTVTNNITSNSGNIIITNGDLSVVSGNVLPSATGNTQTLGSSIKYFANLYSTTINSTTINGTIATVSQPSITSLGTLNTLLVTPTSTNTITVNLNTSTSNQPINILGNYIGTANTSDKTIITISNTLSPATIGTISNVYGIKNTLSTTPGSNVIITNMFFDYLYPNYRPAASTTTSNLYAKYINMSLDKTNVSAVVTNSYGLFIDTITTINANTTTFTNIYGGYFKAPTNGTYNTSLFSDNMSIAYTSVTPPTGGLIVSGNVGIGTSSPGNKLDIISSGASLRISASSTSGYGFIQLGQSSTASNNYCFGSEGDGKFSIWNGNWGTANNLINIFSGGNVSIGNTNNTYKLDVSGIIHTNSQITLDTNQQINFRSDVVNGGGYFIGCQTGALNTSINVAGDASTIRGVEFTTSSTSQISGTLLAGAVIYPLKGAMSIGTTFSSSRGPDNSLIIQDKLGVGNTDPGSSLMVGNGISGYAPPTSKSTISLNGASTIPEISTKPGIYHRHGIGLGVYSDANMSFQVYGSTSLADAMYIKYDGSVGIGTINPQTVLHIKKDTVDTTNYIYMENWTSGGSAGLKLSAVDNSWYTTITQFQNTGMVIDFVYNAYFKSNGVDKMCIMGSGTYANHVGIGTTTPQSHLTINSTFTSTDVRIQITDATTGNATDQTGLALIKASNQDAYLYNFSNTPLRLGTNGTDRLVILANGLIGINNGSPSYQLDVGGTFRATGVALLSSTLGVTGATTLSSTLGVTGATTLSSTLGVTGVTTMSSDLYITGIYNNTLVGSSYNMISLSSGTSLSPVYINGTHVGSAGDVALYSLTATMASSATQNSVVGFKNSITIAPTAGTITLACGNVIYPVFRPFTSTIMTVASEYIKLQLDKTNDGATIDNAYGLYVDSALSYGSGTTTYTNIYNGYFKNPNLPNATCISLYAEDLTVGTLSSQNLIPVTTDSYYLGTYVYNEVQRIASGGTGSTSFPNASVTAISNDGSTLAVGGPYNNSNIGAVWVYIYTGTWTLQQGPITNLAYPSFGCSLALAYTGDVMIVGANAIYPGSPESSGGSHVYTRVTGTWNLTYILSFNGGPYTGIGNVGIGTSTAISEDGRVFMTGAPYYSPTLINRGRVFISVEGSNPYYTTGATTNMYLGFSVALSYYGDTAAFGAYNYNNGIIYIVTTSYPVSTSAVYTQQAAIGGTSAGDQFGYSVSLSNDGNTVLVGAVGYQSGNGAGYIYTRSGSTWSLAAGPLTQTTTGMGTSCSLSSDGSYAILGAPGDSGGIGAAFIYKKFNNGWIYLQKIKGSNIISNPQQGALNSVSISGDSSLIAVGGPIYNQNTSVNGSGAVWLYSKSLKEYAEVYASNLVLSNSASVAGAVTVSGALTVGSINATLSSSNYCSVTGSNSAANSPIILNGTFVGGSSLDLVGLYVTPTYNLSSNKDNVYGIKNEPVINATAGTISNVIGSHIYPRITPFGNVSKIISNLINLTLTKTNTSVITDLYGLFIDAPATSGVGATTVTNAYGGFFINPNLATNNYAIYTDDITVGSQTKDATNAIMRIDKSGANTCIKIINTGTMSGYISTSSSGLVFNTDTVNNINFRVGAAAATTTPQTDGSLIAYVDSTAFNISKKLTVVDTSTTNNLIPPQDIYGNVGLSQFVEAFKNLYDEHSSDYFYYGSTCLSGNGDTLVIGAPQKYNNNTAYQNGRITIFARSGDTWVQQYDIESDTAAQSGFGRSVSISYDGTKILVGCSKHDLLVGDPFVGAYMLTYNGGGYTKAGILNQAIDSSPNNSTVGFAVAISSDGNVGLVGGFYDNTIGCVYIFVNSVQIAKLVGLTFDNKFGYALSSSSDGTTIAVGAYGYSTTGAVMIYTTASPVTGASVYSLQTTLYGTLANTQEFGFSVSLSDDGNTLAVGGRAALTTGAFWSYTRTGTTWSLQAGPISRDTSGLGSTISLSGDGSMVAVGAYMDSSSVGAAFIYKKYGTTWVYNQKVVGTLGSSALYSSTPMQGYTNSLSLSKDKSTLSMGGINFGYLAPGYQLVKTKGSAWAFNLSSYKYADTSFYNSHVTNGINIGLTDVITMPLQINAASNTNVVQLDSTITTNTSNLTSYGIYNIPTFSTGTGSYSSIYSAYMQLKGAAAADNAYSLYVANPTTGTNKYALYSENLTVSGSTTLQATTAQSLTISGSATTQTITPVTTDTYNVGIMNYSLTGSKITPLPGSAGNAGVVVVVSDDENTMAISSVDYLSLTGRVWIYTKNNGYNSSTWVLQGTLTGAITPARFGTSLSISADGNTLVVGAISDTTDGATYVYFRDYTGSWTAITSVKLIGSGGATVSQQGTAVSISKDANVIAVGGPGYNVGATNTGAVWLFFRSGYSYSQLGSIITIGTANINFGGSVALSYDGSTLAVSVTGDTSSTGGAYIYSTAIPITTTSVWALESTKLVGSGSATAQYQGRNINLSYNGNTMCFGGYGYNSNNGAVWVFNRTGVTTTAAETWTQQAGPLTQTTTYLSAASIHMSADGDLIAVSSTDGGAGAVYMWSKSNTTWTFNQKILPSGLSATPSFSSSIYINRSKSAIVIGASSDNVSGVVAGSVVIYGNNATEYNQVYAGNVITNSLTSKNVSIYGKIDTNNPRWSTPLDSNSRYYMTTTITISGAGLYNATFYMRRLGYIVILEISASSPGTVSSVTGDVTSQFVAPIPLEYRPIRTCGQPGNYVQQGVTVRYGGIILYANPSGFIDLYVPSPIGGAGGVNSGTITNVYMSYALDY